MKYNKPELIEAGLALEAVQGAKPNETNIDDGLYTLNAAYEVDE